MVRIRLNRIPLNPAFILAFATFMMLILVSIPAWQFAILVAALSIVAAYARHPHDSLLRSSTTDVSLTTDQRRKQDSLWPPAALLAGIPIVAVLVSALFFGVPIKLALAGWALISIISLRHRFARASESVEAIREDTVSLGQPPNQRGKYAQ